MLKFCVLGSGIGYTLSPIIHATVFGELGVSAIYGVTDIPVAALRGHVDALKNEYDGFNVTKPFKKEIMLYLDEVDGKTNAVNTVKREGGKHTGYNTDVFGFAESLKSLVPDLHGINALVLGAGGACESVVSALKDGGADVTVINRTYGRAELVSELYGVKAARSVSGLRPELLVNCTSVGNDGVTSPIPYGTDMSALRYGYDLVYSPAHTAFMKDCESVGAKTSNGLGMLVCQAIKADEIFLGRKLDVLGLYKKALKAAEDKLK